MVTNSVAPMQKTGVANTDLRSHKDSINWARPAKESSWDLFPGKDPTLFFHQNIALRQPFRNAPGANMLIEVVIENNLLPSRSPLIRV